MINKYRFKGWVKSYLELDARKRKIRKDLIDTSILFGCNEDVINIIVNNPSIMNESIKGLSIIFGVVSIFNLEMFEESIKDIYKEKYK